MSLTKEGIDDNEGCSKWSRNSEIFSMGLPMAEMIGWPEGGRTPLCIFSTSTLGIFCLSLYCSSL